MAFKVIKHRLFYMFMILKWKSDELEFWLLSKGFTQKQVRGHSKTYFPGQNTFPISVNLEHESSQTFIVATDEPVCVVHTGTVDGKPAVIQCKTCYIPVGYPPGHVNIVLKSFLEAYLSKGLLVLSIWGVLVKREFEPCRRLSTVL